MPSLPDALSLYPLTLCHWPVAALTVDDILQFRNLNSEDYKQILPNLELHYQDFLRESQDSHMFGADDRIQIEREYKLTTQHYEQLLRSLERGTGKIKKWEQQ